MGGLEAALTALVWALVALIIVTILLSAWMVARVVHADDDWDDQ